MTPVNLAYLWIRDIRRGGKVYTYADYRRGGRCVPIADESGRRLLPVDPAFVAAYQRIHDTFERQPTGVADDPRGSVAHLVTAYLGSAEFRQLNGKTQADYRRYLDDLRQRARDRASVSLPAVKMPRTFVGKLRDKFADTPAAANRYVTVIRLLYAWAAMRGEWRVVDNPADGWKKLKTGPGWRAWTAAEWSTLQAEGSPEMRRAAALAYYTGLRRGDVLSLTWRAYDGAAVELVTSKRGVQVWIPAHAELRRVLADTPKVATTILTDARGLPWLADTFSHGFADELERLGIEGATFHGLRKNAGINLAEAGCTAHQIQAILGCSLENAEHYCKAASQKVLATAAIARLERRGNVE